MDRRGKEKLKWDQKNRERHGRMKKIQQLKIQEKNGEKDVLTCSKFIDSSKLAF